MVSVVKHAESWPLAKARTVLETAERDTYRMAGPRFLTELFVARAVMECIADHGATPRDLEERRAALVMEGRRE